MARQQSAAAQEKGKNETLMLYSCGQSYESCKAHAEHLKSTSLTGLNVNEHDENEEEEEDEDDYGDLDPSCCFMCDEKHDTIESCIVHLHKQHGLFIPDVEYLKDPKGLLTCLGLKVMREYRCLYCNDRCRPFSSLEAVRKHMAAKSHCKVHYGDDNEEEEVELEEFYDYSSSYVDEQGKQLVASGESANNVELGTGGSELIIIKKSNDGHGMSAKTLGSREFLRYYRQKPRPSPANNTAAAAATAAARQRSMCLASVQSKEHRMTLKVLKEMNRSGVETARSKIGTKTKSNMIRNLPKNLPRQTRNRARKC